MIVKLNLLAVNAKQKLPVSCKAKIGNDRIAAIVEVIGLVFMISSKNVYFTENETFRTA